MIFEFSTNFAYIVEVFLLKRDKGILVFSSWWANKGIIVNKQKKGNVEIADFSYKSGPRVYINWFPILGPLRHASQFKIGPISPTILYFLKLDQLL